MRQKPLFTSSFRRRVLGSLGVLLGLLLFGYLFEYVYEETVILSSPSNSAYKVNRILHANNPDEIPIFGSSRALQSFLPSVLGKQFFNYGIDGAYSDVQLFFLEQECKKQKNNPYVLLTLDMEGFAYGLGDPNAYIPNVDHSAVKKLMKGAFKPHYRLPVVKYYGKYETYLKDYLNGHLMTTKYNDKGASVEKQNLPAKRFKTLVEERKNTVMAFRTDTVLTNRFIRLFNENPHRMFIIVVPPYHPSFFNRYENYAAAQAFMDYLSTFPNVVFLNYGQYYYPDDCYFNTTHLNYKGVVRFNKMLKDTLDKVMRPEFNETAERLALDKPKF